MQSQKLHMFIPAVLFAAAFAAMDASAVTTRTWDGGGSTTNWSDGNNWSPNGVPGASDPVIFNGTSSKNCTFTANDSCGSVSVNSGYNGTITFSANLTVNGSFTINSANGTVAFSGSPTLTVEGSFTKSAGTFNAGNSTVSLTTSTAANLSGGLTFKNLEVNKGAHVTVNSTGSSPVIVTGTLTLTNGYLDSQTPSDPSKGVLCARGTIDQNTGFDGGTAQLWIDGTGNQTLDGSGSNAYGDLPDVTVNKPATSKLTLVGIVRSSQDLKLLSGDLVAGSSTWRSVDSNNVTITGDIKFYDLDINLGTGYTFDVLGNVTVSGTLLLNNGILKLHDDKHLCIKGNVSTVASGTSIVPNLSTVEVCGTAAQTIDWQDKSLNDLEVTNINGLVSFTTGLTLNSGSTFYIKPGASVQFQSYKDYYFNGQLDWNGQPGNLITISSSGSAKYTAHTTGARNLTYVNIERCEVSGGTYYAYESIDGGSNVNVVFVAAGTPIPADDSYEAVEDTTLDIPQPGFPGVLANDIDPQGNPITAIKITNPSHGSVTLNADGSFTYTPEADYFGTDSFTYKASDGSHQSTAATVTLTVAGTQDPPTANNGSASGEEDKYFYAYMSGSDPDGDTLTYSIVSQGAKGTVQIQNVNTGYFKYTPNPDANGQDMFTFKVNDGTVDSQVATFTIAISPKDDPVVALAGTLTVCQDVPASGTLMAVDVDGDPLTYSINDAPNKGTVVVTNVETGDYVYTPNPGITGADSFEFKVDDSHNIAKAIITVTIIPNQAPVANNGAFATDEDADYETGQLSATDADGNALTYSIVSNGSKGSATITDTTTGAFTYVPSPNANGGDTFTFKANDGYLDSNVATATVTINPINDAPVFDGGATFGLAPIEEDETDNAGTAIIDLIASGGAGAITDVDASPQQGLALVGANAANGAWQFSTNKGVDWNLVGVPDEENALLLAADVDAQDEPLTIIRFVPAPDFNGTIVGALTFRAWDRTSGANGTTANISTNGGTTAFSPTTNTASLTVTPVNDPPAAANGNLGVMEDSQDNPGTLVATDVENSPLTYSIVANGGKGTAVITDASTGDYTYTPNPNAFGSDTFTFKAYDGELFSAEATISVNITNVNDPPTVQGAALTTDEDVAIPVTLSAQDVDGAPLTYTIDPSPQHGTLTGTAPNLTYTPAAEYSGDDSFVFKVNDGIVDSGTATVTITINNLNDAPVLSTAAVFQMDSILEDETDNAGTLIKDLINNAGTGVITDADADPEQGLALFGFYYPGGDFEWSSDNGLTWLPLAGGGDTLLLNSDDDTRIRFVPPENANGTIDPIFSIRVWDRTAGNSGDVITITQTGGSSAFSAQAKTVSLEITPVNDAPIAFDDFNSVIYENETADPWIYANDPDLTPIEDLTFVIVTPPEHGTLTGTGYQLTYTPDPDFFGIDTFYFLANDGELDSNVAQILITVLEVDDVPPVIETLTPSNLTWVNVDRPTITAAYSDYFSGVSPELSELVIHDFNDGSKTININDISAFAGPTGFSYTPSNPLSEGEHDIDLTILDNWYNATNAYRQFYVDTLPPVIDLLVPIPDWRMETLTPTLSATFSDPLYDPNGVPIGSGVDVNRVFVVLDGIDVTADSMVSSEGFMYIPPENLTEDMHTVSVTVYDVAGNATTEVWNFGAYRHSVGYVWTGLGNNNNWDNSANWVNLMGSGPAYPGEGQTVVFDATSSKDCSINGAGQSCGWLIVSKGYKGKISANAPFLLNGDLVLRDGVFDAKASTMTVWGNIELYTGAAFECGTGTVVLEEDSNSTITGGPVFANLTVSKSNPTNTADFVDGLTVLDNLTLSSGTLVLPSIGDVIVDGNMTLAPEGTVVPNASTFILQGSAPQTLDFGGNDILNLSVLNDSYTYTFRGGFNTLPGGTFKIRGNARIDFEAGKTYAVENLDWQADSTQIQLLRSGASGTWNLESAVPQTVVDVRVGNCNASVGTFTAYRSIDQGGNQNWVFDTDITPPSIAITGPTDGSVAASRHPVITGTYSDTQNQIDTATLVLTFLKNPADPFPETVNVQGKLLKTATGFTFTPSVNLDDGFEYAVLAEVSDRAAQSNFVESRFTIDATGPSFSAHAPVTGYLTNNAGTVISATYSDSGSGVNAANAVFILDNVDRTGDATVSSTSFQFTPPTALADGYHTYSLTIKDLAGTATTVSETFLVDTIPPPLPVIDRTIRTYDRVTVIGQITPDTADANLQSVTNAGFQYNLLGGNFIVVFSRIDGDDFSFDLSLVDLAGNTSSVLPVSETFVTDPPPDPPDPESEPPLEILGVSLIPPGDKTVIERDGTTISNSENFTVKFMVAGGISPYKATINGGAAEDASGAGFEMALNDVPEGRQEVFIQVTDSAGSTASTTVVLVSDRSAPAVVLSTPLKTTTADLSVLVLGPANLQVYDDPATQDSEALRNVFGYDTFDPAGDIQDAYSEPVEVRVAVRAVELNSEGLRHDFAGDPDSGEVVEGRPDEALDLPLGTELSKAWAYSDIGDFLQGIEEWALERTDKVVDSAGQEVDFTRNTMPALPVDTRYFTKFKSYQLFVTTRDVLGNEATERVLNFALDLTAPHVRGIRIFSPVITVDADNDVFIMKQETTSGPELRMRREYYGENPQFASSVWRLAEPVTFPGTSKVAEPIRIYAEDIAGNVSSGASGVFVDRIDTIEGSIFGNGEDNGRKRPMAGDEQISRGQESTGQGNQRFLIKYQRSWAGKSVGYYASPVPWRQYATPFYDEGTGNKSSLITSTLPSAGPFTVHLPDGLFPAPTNLLLPRTDQMAVRPDQYPGGVYDFNLPRGDGLSSPAIFDRAGMDTVTVDLFGFGPSSQLPRFKPKAPDLLGPTFYWSGVDPAVVANDPRLTAQPIPSGYQKGQANFNFRLVGMPRNVQPGFTGFQYTVEDTDSSGEQNYPAPTGTFNMPGEWQTNLNLIRVDPSTIKAGRRITIDILGANLAILGESVDANKIIIKAPDGTVVSMLPPPPPPPEGEPEDNTADKIVIHSAWGATGKTDFGWPLSLAGRLCERLKLDITLGKNLQMGLYDFILTTPDGMTLAELKGAINVVNLNLAFATKDEDGTVRLVNGVEEQEDPFPTVDLEVIILRLHDFGKLDLKIKGRVRDGLSEAVLDPAQTLQTVKLLVDHEVKEEIPVTYGGPQYPWKERTLDFSFERYITVECKEGSHFVSLQATNAVGNLGEETWGVPVTLRPVFEELPIISDPQFTGNEVIILQPAPQGAGAASVNVLFGNNTNNVELGKINFNPATGKYTGTVSFANGGTLSQLADMVVTPSSLLAIVDTNREQIHTTALDGHTACARGEHGTGDGQFDHPTGIGIDSEGIRYVADTGNSRIQVFDAGGVFADKFGSLGSGDGQFDAPTDIAVTSDGKIYVVDSGNNRIQRFDSEYQFEAAWGTEGNLVGQFSSPTSIAVDGSDALYVADTGNNRIQKFTAAGVFVWASGLFGVGDGEFDGPVGLAVTAEGNLLVVDTNNNRVQVLDTTGAYVDKFGTAGSGDGQFNGPTGVAVDPEGFIYVSDTWNHRVQKFDAELNFVAAWTVQGEAVVEADLGGEVDPEAAEITGTVNLTLSAGGGITNMGQVFHKEEQKFVSNVKAGDYVIESCGVPVIVQVGLAAQSSKSKVTYLRSYIPMIKFTGGIPEESVRVEFNGQTFQVKSMDIPELENAK